MLLTCDLFLVGDTRTVIPPEKAWVKRYEEEKKFFQTLFDRAELVENRIAFLELCEKIRQTQFSVRSSELTRMLKEAQAAARDTGKSWYYKVTKGTMKINNLIRHNGTHIVEFIAEEVDNLNKIIPVKEFSEARFRKMDNEEPKYYYTDSYTMNIKQSQVAADGLFNLATSNLQDCARNTLVKNYLLTSPMTALHLLHEPEMKPDELVVIMGNKKYGYQYGYKQPQPVKAASVTFDNCTEWDKDKISDIFKHLRQCTVGPSKADDIYMLTNSAICKQSSLVKTALLTNAFKFIFDVNSDAVTLAQQDECMIQSTHYLDVIPYMSSKLYDRALLATYARRNVPEDKIERLNRADKRASAIVTPPPESFMPPEETDIADKNIRRARRDKFEIQ